MDRGGCGLGCLAMVLTWVFVIALVWAWFDLMAWLGWMQSR